MNRRPVYSAELMRFFLGSDIFETSSIDSINTIEQTNRIVYSSFFYLIFSIFMCSHINDDDNDQIYVNNYEMIYSLRNWNWIYFLLFRNVCSAEDTLIISI